MIQRIQTLYLLLAYLFLAMMLWFPVGEVRNAADEVHKIGAMLAFTGYGWILFILVSFVKILVLLSVFLYKKRRSQRRLTLWLGFFSLLVFGAALIFLLNHQEGTLTYKPALVFPVISAVLLWMASARIKKDEDKVKAYERIR
jgi:hypothetical protein